MPNNIIMADKTGGEWTTLGIAQGLEPNGEITLDSITLAYYAFASSAITKFRGTNIILPPTIKPFNGSQVEEVFLQSDSNTQIHGLFSSCAKLKKIVLVVANNKLSTYSMAQNDAQLEIFDITGALSFQTNGFSGCTNLKTLILRNNNIYAVQNTAVFNGTPFASGGAGGTIYIPKSLYDQLGTGTNDYKAASVWSTLDGYGTIAWKQIEGSIYETQYADGTPIPSA